MKKEIINGLIKVANNLDLLGYKEEANIVDRVAKKIVVSKNPVIQNLDLGQALSIPVTGDYKTDILSYKRLSGKAYFMKRKYPDDDRTNKYFSIIRNFMKKINRVYEEPKLSAFIAQANRIEYDNSSETDVNYQLGDAKTESLNEYLYLYNITDQEGNLESNIKTLADFNKAWNNFKNQAVIKKQIAKYPNYLQNHLSNTYNLLSAKLK